MKRITTFAVLFLMILQIILAAPAYTLADEEGTFLFDHINKGNSYEAYLKNYEGVDKPETEIFIPGAEYAAAEDAGVKVHASFQDCDGSVLEWNDYGSVEWEVDIPQDGLYNLSIRYFTIEGKSSSIERELLIDGKRPFNEVRTLLFPRVWRDKTAILQDNQGNDVRPSQEEYPIWQEKAFSDASGLFKEPFYFYLTKGKHLIRLNAVREPIVIEYIRVFQYRPPQSYEEAVKDYQSHNYSNSQNQEIKIQGENTYLKSEPTLYPVFDRSNPLNEPYDPAKIKFNCIGGYNWRKSGQWISWKFDVPETGLYKMGVKFRQNTVMGIPVTRSIEIDGNSPFMEVQRVPFGYDTNWQFKVVGAAKEEPYLFYLEKGEHTLRMEANMGDISEVIRAVEQSAIDLSQLYSKIIMITGPNPDPFRDYQLEKRIDGLLPTLEENAVILRDQVKLIKELAGSKVSEAVMLDRIAFQLESLVKDPQTLPSRLTAYRDNLSSLAYWSLMIREQPMDVDYVVFESPDRQFPRANPNFLEKGLHWIRSFIASFTEDYTSIGNVYDSKEAINVWVLLGRDQADTLKAMIDDDFTSKSNIKVNLNIMQNETVLLFAASSNDGPDVALNISRTLPVDYGIRNALVDLSTLPDYQEVADRFKPTAIIPYAYNGKVYGLPQTQSFPILFYRKDILERLDLKVPNTWEEVYDIISVLQEHNLEFAPGMGFDLFNAFLMQSGGEYYTKDMKRSDLDSPTGIKVFTEWTDIYTHYGLPLFFDFYNRFRNGEMPIGIADYTFYNQLSVAAPEIKGLWDIAPLPGTLQPDGTINRTIGGNGTAAAIFKETDNLEASWEFMKWWTSRDTQVRFGRELEALMGPAARYNTANVEALGHLPWPTGDYNKLMEQWDHVKEIPIVPGSYYTSRHLDNAFRETVINGEIPREAITKYVKEINKEIRKKREEFGLEN